MLKRFCLKQGCGELVEFGRCEAHKVEAKVYDQYRGSAASRGYGYKWSEYSKRYRRKHPLCVTCLDKGHITPSAHVDHIVAVKGAGDPLFWKEENHRALCASCHSVKTVKEDGGFGNGQTERG